jgi:hypothetical protein
MKGAAVSTENCQQSHLYCIWWRRVGSPDRFRHWVLADSIEDAVCRSRLDMSKALGTNTGLWKIEEPGNKITRWIPTALVYQFEGPRRSHRVRIIASVLLLLCLFFLFYWKSRTVASAGPYLERIRK